jgi:uncharacterized protein with von Willebrand factor type A (vWA) domain
MFEEYLKKVWPKVRRNHLFPQIPPPQLVESDEEVALEIKSKQMTINVNFLQVLTEKMSPEDALQALLDHGISHYMYCPWDFNTHLMLYSEAKKVLRDKRLAQKAASYFMDVVANTYCVKERETKIPELYRHLPKEGVQRILALLYQVIWGIDLGVQGEEENIKRLSRIPYLEKRLWKESVKKFAKTIEEFLQKEMESEQKSHKKVQNPLGEHSLENYTLEEIDKGLREFASSVDDITEFRETVEDLKDELAAMGYTVGGMGRGAGNPIDADLLYYMKLAENYTLPVKKLPMEKSGALHPYSHSPWEIGKPVQDIDPWTSFGKIMPGLTQTWVRREGEVFGEMEKIPDCLIIIDSSGSMTNPRERLSYAVLGAACACNAYLKNGKKVAVYNFSDAFRGNKLILDFCKEKEPVYWAICRYFGGGTAIDLNDINYLLKQAEKPDIFIITDMQITNLEKLIDFFNSIENRVTAVHIGENIYAARFREGLKKKNNVSLFLVKDKEDIPKIVLGKVREYFASPF